MLSAWLQSFFSHLYVTTNKNQTDVLCTYQTALQINSLFNITVTVDQSELTVKHVHTCLEDTVSFFSCQRHLTSHFESFKCLQAKVANASHTPKVWWWAGITKQFIVSTLQDLPIQDLLKHLMRHILWFSPFYWRLTSWQASLFRCHF